VDLADQANAAYQKRGGGARRGDEVSLDEVLPCFHEDGYDAFSIADWSAEIDDPALQGELRGVLTSALGELPDHYRAVIVPHDVEGLSMAEAADSLGITVATAQTPAHRGRLLLRKRLAIFMSGATSPVRAAS